MTRIYRLTVFPNYMDLSIHGSLARELPAVVADTAKAEGVALQYAPGLSVTGNFQYVVLRGFPAAEGNSFGFAATLRLRCGRRATPSGAARGDCVDRCQLPREGAWGRVAGVAREDKIFRPQKIFLLHESYGNWLPREGAAEG